MLIYADKVFENPIEVIEAFKQGALPCGLYAV